MPRQPQRSAQASRQPAGRAVMLPADAPLIRSPTASN